MGTQIEMIKAFAKCRQLNPELWDSIFLGSYNYAGDYSTFDGGAADAAGIASAMVKLHTQIIEHTT